MLAWTPSRRRPIAVRAGRRLGAAGLISAGEGNLSVRLDADRLLVTPTGRRKDELERRRPRRRLARPPGPRRASRAAGLGPTSDLAIHLAVHAARPDIGAVAHAHLPAAMALTLAGEVPDPAALPETALFLPRLPYLSFGDAGQQRAGRPRSRRPSPSRRSRCAAAVLLERHGAVAVGRDPDQARRPARARRGPVPDVARRAPDSRGAGPHVGMVDDAQAQGRRHGGNMNAREVPRRIARHVPVHDGRLHVGRGHQLATPADAQPARRAVLVRSRPAGRDLRLRPHLRRALQPGRHGRDGPRQAHDRRSRPSATSSPRSSARSAPPRSSWSTVSQDAVAAGITKPGAGITRHQRPDPRDHLHRDLPRGHPDRVQAAPDRWPAWPSR